MAQSISYETPEEDASEFLQGLGKEVELTMFKTNVKDEPQKRRPEGSTLGIVCVGDHSDNWDKIVYIRHYLQEIPKESDSHYVIGVETAEKQLTWPKGSESRVRLHFTVLGQHLPDQLIKLYLSRKHSKVEIVGAVVFWGPNNHSSLHSAIEWKKVVEQSLPEAANKIPFVLLVDNISRVQWMGDRKVIRDQEAMHSFCQKHGFLTWFEMLNSDWKFGEKNVFGRAVESILKNFS